MLVPLAVTSLFVSVVCGEVFFRGEEVRKALLTAKAGFLSIRFDVDQAEFMQGGVPPVRP